VLTRTDEPHNHPNPPVQYRYSRRRVSSKKEQWISYRTYCIGVPCTRC